MNLRSADTVRALQLIVGVAQYPVDDVGSHRCAVKNIDVAGRLCIFACDHAPVLPKAGRQAKDQEWPAAQHCEIGRGEGINAHVLALQRVRGVGLLEPATFVLSASSFDANRMDPMGLHGAGADSANTCSTICGSVAFMR